MLAIFIVRAAPKTDHQRCVGNLPADSLERMSQVRRAAAESEVGQADNLYVGIVEAHDVRGRHSGIVLHAASQPMFFKQLDQHLRHRIIERSPSGDAENGLRARSGREIPQDRNIRQRRGLVALLSRRAAVVFSRVDRRGYVLVLNGIRDQLMHRLVYLLNVLRIELSTAKIDLGEMQRLQYHIVVNIR